MTKFIEMLKTAIEVCGVERTVMAVLLVSLFFVLALITMCLLFKAMINNIVMIKKESEVNE